MREPQQESTQLSEIQLCAQNGEMAEAEDMCDKYQSEAHVFCKRCNKY